VALYGLIAVKKGQIVGRIRAFFARNPTSGFMILEFGFMIDGTRPIFQKSSIKNQKLRASGMTPPPYFEFLRVHQTLN